MIQFPETARIEWETVADAAEVEAELRKRIHRGTEVEKEVERLKVRHEASLTFQQELDADSTPELEMISLTNFKADPAAAPTDLIEGVMKADATCIVLGPSGSGKSTVALSMLHSLMTGEDWLDQSVQRIDGAVGIVSYDMDAAMILDWMSGFPNIDPDKVSVVNAHRRGNPLGVPAIRSQITALWKKMEVEVIVIDSFSASFFGNDQNDAAATMSHYRDMQSFTRECGAKTLIVIVHALENDPTRVRGSKVHHDVADTIVAVEGTGSESRRIRMAKYRAALGQHMMNPGILTEPDAVTHLVSLDYGEMSIAGMPLPAKAIGQSFPDLPEVNDEPDLDWGESEDDL